MRRLLWGLSLLGDMYLCTAASRYEALLLGRPVERPWPLEPPITLLPPPPGHPEQLIPDVPLSAVELALRSELRHLERLLPGGTWR
ncbi:DUF6059 family protein [Kitasatospora sp. NPDC059673]|uniref:DUF6059 family protein n=1 Tax=Kitasatospora sp. NPDC059673 TaxID=3346901 RepID=UPI0036829F32